MRGLWMVGGRRLKGESPVEAMCLRLDREIGLQIDPKRFEFVTVIEYVWQKREQEPQNNGSQNLLHQFAVELTDSEIAGARLDTTEHDTYYGLQEFDRARLVAEKVHPAILHIYDMVFMPRWQRIRRALRGLFCSIFS